MRFRDLNAATLEVERRAGSRLRRNGRAAHCADVALRRRLPPSLKGWPMVEPIIGLAIGALLGAYLLYTLIYPERF